MLNLSRPQGLTHGSEVSLVPSPISSLTQFQDRITNEFIQGSGIDPAFMATLQFCVDTDSAPGQEARYPIHEALNWHVTRFGYYARPHQAAVLLRNADGSIWQAKLAEPLWDQKKGKPRKYETPIGNGSKPYLPAIPASIRARIAERWQVTIPATGDFWGVIADHPEIPIILTEGGKKALALLSLGYVAIALYGVNGGYRTRDALGHQHNPTLLPDLQPFITEGRRVSLAFDADTKEQAKRRVAKALQRFGQVLCATGATVQVATWAASQGKGVDDLIVQSGAAAWETAYAEASPFADWKVRQRLLNQLTIQLKLRVCQADLSQLQVNDLPASGLIALKSAKGTGKTKFIGQRLLAQADKAIGLTHRICLGRNLCERWQLDYRGDIDKVNGDFITGSAYTWRVGGCVDSLLAFDPNRFQGCDLVIDEVVQVLRHLLTSATCHQEGKRPALLKRFQQLLTVARRVIVADADLDDASLEYLQTLRGQSIEDVFLIQNDYTPAGYPVRFIESKNDSAAIALLGTDVAEGKKVFIVTDSLRRSKALARFCEDFGIQPLLINSETSGGELERAFIAAPDQHAHNYQVVIASPSLATGVSIEQDYFEVVYGLFYGAASTDADLAQALGRVRAPVARVVWCALKGRQPSHFGRSHYAHVLRATLQQRTAASQMCLDDALSEEMLYELSQLVFSDDPHIKLWSQIEAGKNQSLQDLRNSLRVRLNFEGNTIAQMVLPDDRGYHQVMTALRAELKQAEALQIVKARCLTATEAKTIERKENPSPEERLALKRYQLCSFYVLNPKELTVEQVLSDRQGRRRSELLRLEAQLLPGIAQARDVQSLNQQLQWRAGLTPWNLAHSELQRRVVAQIGLERFLEPGLEWTAAELQPVAAMARQHAQAIKTALNYTISAKTTDTQIVHELLLRFSLKTHFRWARDYPGQEGTKVRVFRLNAEVYAENLQILQRRQALQEEKGGHGSTSSLINSEQPGVIQLMAHLEKVSVLVGAGLATTAVATAADALQPGLREEIPLPGELKTA